MPNGQFVGGLGGQAEATTLDGIVLMVQVTSGRYGGGLVGYANHSVIDRVDAQITISSPQGDIGGLIGAGHEIRMQRATATVSVNAGGQNAGGLIGHGRGWTHACGVYGSVQGTSHVGGVTGGSQAYTIFDTYSHAAVEGIDSVGGLAGQLNASKISRVFSTGTVVGSGDDVGGLAGRIFSLTAHHAYWNTESSGISTSPVGTSLSSVQMAGQASFPMFNFLNIWEMKESATSPTLRSRWDLPAAPRPVTMEDLAGGGTAEDPFLLHDASELRAIRLAPTAHYRLAQDIDAAETAFWFTGLGWEPPGTSTNRFRGGLDGAGHTIMHLTVNREADAYGSLLGYIDGARVSNLHVRDAHVFSNSYAGALVGFATGAILENIEIAGVVGSPGNIVGGAIGFQSGGSLRRMHFEGTVMGQSEVGGLAGDVQFSAVASEISANAEVRGIASVGGLFGRIYMTSVTSDLRLASSSGQVTGTSRVGGLIGHNFRGQIADVHSSARVTGTTEVGGLIGRHESLARLDRAHAEGPVAGETNVGGLVGHILNSDVINSFWDFENTGQASSAGGLGLTTEQMRTQSSFPNFDFERTWQIEEGVSSPVFRDFSAYSSNPEPLSLAALPGSGSTGDPYRISSASALNAMRLDPSGHFSLEADIDLTDSAIWDMGRGWQPIGTSSTPFTGTFDGKGHTIRNFTINRPAAARQGLFGSVEAGGVIRNLRVEGANLQSGSQSGILAGYANNAAFDNVTVEGTLFSLGDSVGGLIGESRGTAAYVSRAFADARVWGRSQVGGLLGYAYLSPQVRYSASTGEVHGSAFHCGGLIGYSFGGQIADVYSQSSVNGNERVGGLIGTHGSGSRLDRGYANGPVNGNTDVGGLVGVISGSTLSHAVWDVEATGQTANAGGGSGLPSAAMRQKSSFAAFNFDTAWAIEEGVAAPVFQDLRGHPGGVESVALASLAGSGTTEDPYMVTTPAELHAVRQDLSAHYRLGNDIDLAASVAWGYGQGWEPIGNSSMRFTGTFDGAGHTIRHLVINRIGGTHQGLFGDLNEGAVVRQLHLEKSHIQAQSRVGLVTGSISFGFLDAITVQGTVAASGGYAGGAVGIISGNSSAVSRVFMDTRVWGSDFVGGLTGYIGSSADIRYTSVKGSVTGATHVGGLVGQNHSGQIVDVYSVATVTGNTQVGGLIGRQNARLHHGYAAGLVLGTGADIGGLVGAQTTGNTTHSFWDTGATGLETSAAGWPLSPTQMRQRASFPSFNFFSAWTIDEGVHAPVFRDLLAYPAEPAPVDPASLPGAGTLDAPYQIANASQLQAMRLAPAAHYRLVGDIDITESLAWDYGRGWSPVGKTGSGEQFSGSLDGAGHTLRGLTINRPNSLYQGLFGHSGSAHALRDFKLREAHVWGASRSAILIGESSGGGEIRDIEISGILLGTGQYAGGAVGYGRSILLDHVHAQVHIEGQATTGGLCGYFGNASRLNHSYVLGNVFGANQTGGLVGYSHVDGRIYDCFARANVTGGDEVGGLVGHQQTNSTSIIRRCYAVGTVSGTGTHIGGLLGRLSTGSVVESYYNTDFSDAPGGGGQGRTTAEMTHPHATGVYEHWDFVQIWMADAGHSLNHGYPVLRGSPLSRVRLLYLAGPGGHLSGKTVQEVAVFEDGEAVYAIAESGAAFSRWSDGRADNPRRDLAVTAPIEVTAHFHSKGRVDIDWYTRHGIAPGAGQNWAHVDVLEWLGKGATLRMEFLAGTDPNNAHDRFMAYLAGEEIHFHPSRADRRYTLWRSINLVDWIIVPGQIDLPGGNGPLIDASPPVGGAFYRVEVALPPAD